GRAGAPRHGGVAARGPQRSRGRDAGPGRPADVQHGFEELLNGNADMDPMNDANDPQETPFTPGHDGSGGAAPGGAPGGDGAPGRAVHGGGGPGRAAPAGPRAGVGPRAAAPPGAGWPHARPAGTAPTAPIPAHGVATPAPALTPAPDWPYGPTPPADATAPAPAATPPRRGPGWGGVGALVVLGMVLSSGATLGGVVAYDQLLDAEPQVSAQPAPETSSEARPAAAVTGEAPNWATVAETVSPSTVAIQVATGGGTSQGTGVVLDEDGSI